MGLPPTHKVDHRPVVVLPSDTAWNHAMIDEELKAISAGDSSMTSRDDHPWARYHQGRTRADLEGVRKYLDPEPDSPPVCFVFRRMKIAQWQRVLDLRSRAPIAGRNLALALSLEAIEGCEFRFSRGGTEAGPLDSDDLDRLRALASDDGFEQLGSMAVLISQELSEDEKKP